MFLVYLKKTKLWESYLLNILAIKKSNIFKINYFQSTLKKQKKNKQNNVVK
ncbi:hypothetical protein SRED_002195 [Spiroplasma melliferum]|uniref:Spiroplasmavirus-related protein n=1 Tax=Spiroplasma melliferum TaxID=2134 RepID=A0ABX5U8Q1_SPIME|nr:hypothetical protein SRED_002195 [Spiroplasma melliferum]